VGIELEQALEDLVDDGAAINIGRKGGIKRGRTIV
jgi:hypothetical protein